MRPNRTQRCATARLETAKRRVDKSSHRLNGDTDRYRRLRHGQTAGLQGSSAPLLVPRPAGSGCIEIAKVLLRKHASERL
ncbi:hypothetical protein SV7mr_12740 [Stieleria bergensis]|uniref:Uncharacterized protein n=1 Tax=Stieleria bergensis TaxID=2528025 RepID=A0A517SRL9_9BACT|nr:hypothetical protein SV7mr_12740 [Planctomycetes bacterium SV_7m_r]